MAQERQARGVEGATQNEDRDVGKQGKTKAEKERADK